MTPRLYERRHDALVAYTWRGHTYLIRLFDASCFAGPHAEECGNDVARLIRRDVERDDAAPRAPKVLVP